MTERNTLAGIIIVLWNPEMRQVMQTKLYPQCGPLPPPPEKSISWILQIKGDTASDTKWND